MLRHFQVVMLRQHIAEIIKDADEHLNDKEHPEAYWVGLKNAKNECEELLRELSEMDGIQY